MIEQIDVFRTGTEQVMSVAMLDPSTVVAASWSGSVFLRSRLHNSVFTISTGGGKPAMAVVASKLMGRIVVAGYDGVVRTFDVGGCATKEVVQLSNMPFTCLAVSEQTQRLAIGGRDRCLFLLDAASLFVILRLTENEDWVESAAISPSGDMVASGTQTGTIHLWECGNGQHVASLKAHSGAVMCLTFSPDGKTLVSGGQDNVIHLWSLGENPAVRATLTGHTATVRGVGYLQNPDVLVSVSQDRTIRFWIPNRAVEIGTRKTDDQWLTGLAIARDGSTMATGSLTGTVRLWKVRAP
jgi:WD40 repeat protein